MSQLISQLTKTLFNLWWWFSHWVVTDSCNTIDCSPSDSSVHGISQARILEWVAISFSWGSFWLRDRTHGSCIGRWVLYHWATREACQALTMCQTIPQSYRQDFVPFCQSSTMQLYLFIFNRFENWSTERWDNMFKIIRVSSWWNWNLNPGHWTVGWL